MKTELRYICYTQQAKNNLRGEGYGPATTTYKCLNSGETTTFSGLGHVSINRAVLRASCHILLSICAKHKDTSKVSVYIRDYHQVGIKWATQKDDHVKTKDDKEDILKDIKVFRKLKSRFYEVNFMWVEQERIKELMK